MNTDDVKTKIIVDTVVKYAPLTALMAVFFFSSIKLLGKLESCSITTLIVFFIANFIYCIIAIKIKKELILERIESFKILIIALVTLQWNLISYNFPLDDFWGFYSLFLSIIALLYDYKITIIGSASLIASAIMSWFCQPDLLPPEQVFENIGLRLICMALTSAMFVILTKNAQHFIKIDEDSLLEIKKKNKELMEINDEIIIFAAQLVEERDVTSGEHLKRMESLVRYLTKEVIKNYPEYNLNKKDVELFAKASTMHDIGKIYISDQILNKPDKLTNEEYEIIKTHCQKGYEIIQKFPKTLPEKFKKCCEEICLYHHERYDGGGYLGLKGEEIPISAQIVAVADVYDALTSKRPYKEAFDSQKAIEMIQENKCGVLPPKIVSLITKYPANFAGNSKGKV